MKNAVRLLILVAVALVGAPSAEAQCPGNTTAVQWPTVSPVWDFCAARPAVTDPNAVDGEGITLIDVKYKGVLVFKRASLPILNVKYQNGCGPSYRDWLWQERVFECGPTVSPGFARERPLRPARCAKRRAPTLGPLPAWPSRTRERISS